MARRKSSRSPTRTSIQRIQFRRNAAPHSIQRGAAGTVLLSWRQAGKWFEIEIAGPLNIEWRAGTKTGFAQGGGSLIRDVAELLKSEIPRSSRRYLPRPNGHSLA